MEALKRKLLEDNGVDVDDAMARFLDKEVLFDKYMKKLPTDETWAALEQAVAGGDCNAAFEASHSLKSYFGNLSIMPLFKSICEVTDLFRAGDFEGGKDKLQETRALRDSICEVIAKLYA